MADWWREVWPMSLLPPAVRWDLACHLDVTTATGLGYLRFAAELRLGSILAYTSQEIELIVVRSQNSTTYDLLLDYEARGGTIQGVQYALEAIGHVAQSVIPAYFGRASRAQSGLQLGQYLPGYHGYPGQFNSGSQQTETSFCNCPQCPPDSGNVLGRSGRPDQVQHQRSVPVGSICSRKSESGNKRRRKPEPEPKPASGTQLSGSGVNSHLTLASDERCGRNTSSQNSQNNSGQRSPFTRKINSGPCGCETCRLGSDPDQTQKLTLDSDPKVPCRFSQGYSVQRNKAQVHKVQTSEHISSGLSKLFLDSNEGTESCSEDVEISDETSFIDVLTESESEQNTDVNSTSESVQVGPVLPSEKRAICSKSDIGQHFLGDMNSICPVCRNFAGATPKSRSRSRNNSSPQKTEVTDTELRRSWHGASDCGRYEQMKKISSDSVLSVSQFQNVDISKSMGDKLVNPRDNSIASTMLSQISPHNSICCSGSIAGVSNCNSDGETSTNNLESTNIRRSTDQQTCSRNIIPSDSSNCSGQQKEALIDIHNRASKKAPITVPHNSLPTSSASIGRGGLPASIAQSNGYRGSGNHERSGDSSNRQGGGDRSGDSSNRQRGGDRESGFSVFVTYGWNGTTDREEFMQDVISFCKEMRRAGIRVKIDMDDSSYASLRLNKLDWIDKNVREAKYVVVCITPTYATDTREPDPRNQASPHSGQLNARYIFDKLREEYYSNRSQNRRTVPVMFSNYGTTADHIPSCMRSTLIYKYPDNVEQIIDALIGDGRFRPQ